MNASSTAKSLLRRSLQVTAPGTDLRDGLDRILWGRTGALIVLGSDASVAAMSSGGFTLDIEFSPTRMRELAKMDGAVVVDQDVRRILAAAVQLLPDPSIETSESGTRHRTAERVAKQTGFPVVSVSQSMQIIALYVEGRRHVLEGADVLIARADQALSTLERYKKRLDEVIHTLTALEVEDSVTIREVASVEQRFEMVRRIAAEIEGILVELGEHGRLLRLQYQELMSGVVEERTQVIRDYPPPHAPEVGPTAIVAALADLDDAQLVDLAQVARTVGLIGGQESIDSSISPLGYRTLSKISRLPGAISDRLVLSFGGIQALLAASVDDLLEIDGVGEHRARIIREGLSRMAEAALLERYS